MKAIKHSAKLTITIALSFIICITVSFLVVLFTDKNTSGNMSINVIDSGIINSSSDDFYGKIISEDLEGEYPYIEVEWFNTTSTNYTGTEEFYIYKTENDKLVDCRKNPDDYAWNDIAYVFSANNSFKMKYYAGDMELDKNETYLLETEIFPTDAYSEKVTMWIEFRTGELTDETVIINNSGSDTVEY